MTTCGCFPTATFFSPACNTSPKSRRTKKWCGVTIATTARGTNHTEIHTCQPIGLDKVMFVVNGLPPRLMVVNIKTGAVEVDHELP